MKGFTLIELLVVIAILLLLLITFIGLTTGSGEKTPQEETEWCKKWENTPQRNIPARCLKYYTN